MELSIFLAKIIGIVFLVEGIALLIKRKELENVIEGFLKKRTLLMIVAGHELIIGLLLINIHNVWIKEWPVIITIVAWGMVLEGIFVSIAPSKEVARFYSSLIQKKCITIMTVIFIALGVYLTNIGFGLF